MKITNVFTLKDLKFSKKTHFPQSEKQLIVEAVKSIEFKNFQQYEKGFDRALQNKLGDNYKPGYKLFKENKSRIKDSESFNHSVDFYNQKKRIAIEVEKTKTTTLLLDVIKFVVGNKKKRNNKALVEYGVLIFPGKYRNRNKPEGQGDTPLNRLKNELPLLSPILFINDILLIEYDTASLF